MKEITSAELKKKFEKKSAVIFLICYLVLTIGIIFINPDDMKEDNILNLDKAIHSLQSSTNDEIGYISNLHKKSDNYELVLKDEKALDYYIKNMFSIDKNNKDYEKLKNEIIKSIDNKTFNNTGFLFLTDKYELSESKLNLIKDKEYKDISFWKKFSNKTTQPLILLFLVAFIIIQFCTIYTDEIVTGMDKLILSSKNKYKVLNKKLSIAIVIPILMYAFYLGIQFISLMITSGLPKNGSLQAFRIYEGAINLKWGLSIYQYILLKISMFILVLVLFSVLAVMISYLTKSSLAAISSITAIVLSTKILLIVPFIPSSIKQIFSIFNLCDVLFGLDSFIGMYKGRINIFNIPMDAYNLIIGLIGSVILLCITITKIRTKKLSVGR